MLRVVGLGWLVVVSCRVCNCVLVCVVGVLGLVLLCIVSL